jgi:hypothetical protein
MLAIYVLLSNVILDKGIIPELDWRYYDPYIQK